jgi:class 3 adenylate cyclase
MSAAEHSFSFTLIGDTVNTAHRLQALTRSLETPLVVSDAVVSAQQNPLSRAALLQQRAKAHYLVGHRRFSGSVDRFGDQTLPKIRDDHRCG